MLIQLVSGELYTPKGQVDTGLYGIVIVGNGVLTIPYSQIKWIYSGEKADEDSLRLRVEAAKPGKMIGDLTGMSADELLRGLYGGDAGQADTGRK